MSINKNLINTSLINAGAAEEIIQVNASVSEFLNITSVIEDVNLALILDTLIINESISLESILKILDSFGIFNTYSSLQKGTSSLVELLALTTTLRFIFKAEVLEDHFISNTSSFDRKVLVKVKNLFKAIDQTSEISFLKESLSEIISILEKVDAGLLKEILETVFISSTDQQRVSFINTLLQVFVLEEETTSSSIFLSPITSSFLMETSEDTKTLFNALIKDDLILFIKNIEEEEFISYLLSPETFSVSTYDNYNFTNSCKFKGSYLFSNNKGLYKYGGVLDDGIFIESRLQTSALSFGSSNLKQVPYFYMGLSNSNKLVLKVSVDGKASAYYQLNKKSEGLNTQKIKIGKGLIGRYFQFEIITVDNTDFSLESLEFTPLKLKRRI